MKLIFPYAVTILLTLSAFSFGAACTKGSNGKCLSLGATEEDQAGPEVLGGVQPFGPQRAGQTELIDPTLGGTVGPILGGNTSAGDPSGGTSFTDLLRTSPVVAKNKGKGFFLFVEANGVDNPVFINQTEPNRGRVFVQDARTGRTQWASDEVEDQIHKLYSDWANGITGGSTPIPPIAQLALGRLNQQARQPQNPSGTQSGTAGGSAGQGGTQGSIVPSHGDEGKTPGGRPIATEEDRLASWKKAKAIFDGGSIPDSSKVGVSQKIEGEYSYEVVQQHCVSDKDPNPNPPIEVAVTLFTEAGTDKKYVAIDDHFAKSGEEEATLRSAWKDKKLDLSHNDEVGALVARYDVPPSSGAADAEIQVQLKNVKNGAGNEELSMMYVRKPKSTDQSPESFKLKGGEDILYCSAIPPAGSESKPDAKTGKGLAGSDAGGGDRKAPTRSGRDIAASCLSCHTGKAGAPQQFSSNDLDAIADSTEVGGDGRSRMPKGGSPLSAEDRRALLEYVQTIEPPAFVR